MRLHWRWVSFPQGHQATAQGASISLWYRDGFWRAKISVSKSAGTGRLPPEIQELKEAREFCENRAEQMDWGAKGSLGDPEAIQSVIEETRQLLARCTPGYWRRGHLKSYEVFAPYPEALEGPTGERLLLRFNDHFEHGADAELVASVPDRLTALLCYIAKLEDEVRSLRDSARTPASQAAASVPQEPDPQERSLPAPRTPEQ